MSIIFEHRYGVTINGKHTYRDYRLLPSIPPVISAPDVREYTIEIPGMDGILDLSEALTGSMQYGMRSASFVYVVYARREQFRQIYRTLIEDIHGKSCTVVLDEEPDMTYTGRLQVSEFDIDGKRKQAKVTISGSLYPWPTELENTGEDWLWDPFNFETGVIDEDDGNGGGGDEPVEVEVEG